MFGVRGSFLEPRPFRIRRLNVPARYAASIFKRRTILDILATPVRPLHSRSILGQVAPFSAWVSLAAWHEFGNILLQLQWLWNGASAQRVRWWRELRLFTLLKNDIVSRRPAAVELLWPPFTFPHSGDTPLLPVGPREIGTRHDVPSYTIIIYKYII